MDFLFDIGRVLLDFHFEPSLHRLLPQDCPNPTERLSALIERRDELESGNISKEDFISWALKTLNSHSTPQEFIHYWRDIFTPNEPMWEIVRKLHIEGHRLILFSNTCSIHCPWVFREFPNFSLFQNAVLSFEVHALKPLPEIYQYAIRTYGLTPEETIYIDDLPDNVATGKRLGFRAFQYNLHDHTAFEKWLNEQMDLCKS